MSRHSEGFCLILCFTICRHHSNRANNHQSNNPHHAAHAHAAAAAHQAVNDALAMPFGGAAFSPFGAFGGLSAFGGMGSPFGAIAGPGMYHNLLTVRQDDMEIYIYLFLRFGRRTNDFHVNLWGRRWVR